MNRESCVYVTDRTVRVSLTRRLGTWIMDCHAEAAVRLGAWAWCPRLGPARALPVGWVRGGESVDSAPEFLHSLTPGGSGRICVSVRIKVIEMVGFLSIAFASNLALLDSRLQAIRPAIMDNRFLMLQLSRVGEAGGYVRVSSLPSQSTKIWIHRASLQQPTNARQQKIRYIFCLTIKLTIKYSIFYCSVQAVIFLQITTIAEESTGTHLGMASKVSGDILSHRCKG